MNVEEEAPDQHYWRWSCASHGVSETYKGVVLLYFEIVYYHFHSNLDGQDEQGDADDVNLDERLEIDWSIATFAAPKACDYWTEIYVW